MSQLALLQGAHRPLEGIGDPLDRVYTPAPCARAIVEALATDYGLERPGLVIEPSVGSGVFVEEARRQWGPRPVVWAYDIDEAAPGLQREDLDQAVVGDWPQVRPDWEISGDVLVLGNPPFAPARAHVDAALDLGPRVTVAFILPLDRLERAGWLDLWTTRRPLAALRPLRPRPWPDRVQGTALYLWRHEVGGRVQDGIVEGRTDVRPLVWS